MVKELEDLSKSIKLLEEKVQLVVEKVNDIVLCLEENNLQLKTPIEFLDDDSEEEDTDTDP